MAGRGRAKGLRSLELLMSLNTGPYQAQKKSSAEPRVEESLQGTCTTEAT